MFLPECWFLIRCYFRNPYLDSDEEADPEDSEAVASMKVDIDLELTAYANARKYVLLYSTPVYLTSKI